MVMRNPTWRGRKHVFGGDVARQAIVVFICRGCGLWHERAFSERARPPAACLDCGRMDFDRFDSKKEAKRWAALQLQQRAGLIDQLERQVRFPLLTVHHATGKPAEWGHYVCDFRYRNLETGMQVIEDVKPEDRIMPDAAIKLRVMEASGRPVTLI